jgi:hypothetical protein
LSKTSKVWTFKRPEWGGCERSAEADIGQFHVAEILDQSIRSYAFLSLFRLPTCRHYTIFTGTVLTAESVARQSITRKPRAISKIGLLILNAME